MLTLDRLLLQRGHKQLTHPLSLTIMPGTALLITGVNGCGKTTLLRTLAGLIPLVSGGNIFYNQHNICDTLPEYMQLIAYSGHNNPTKKLFTVEENINLWAAIYNSRPCTEAALHCFSLTSKKHLPAKNLSQGWQKRLQLSKLLLVPAQIWILDEPTVNLDQEGVTLIEQLINSHTERGNIAVIATNTPLNLTRSSHLNLDEVVY